MVWAEGKEAIFVRDRVMTLSGVFHRIRSHLRARLGVAYDGHLTSRLRLGESAVISGLGVIGLIGVQLAKLAGISPLIEIIGSSAVYGFCDESEMPLREDREFRPTSMYGVSKVAEEVMGYFYGIVIIIM